MQARSKYYYNENQNNLWREIIFSILSKNNKMSTPDHVWNLSYLRAATLISSSFPGRET